jgi:pimeloyl-ACP methyl ester carboxylesterase
MALLTTSRRGVDAHTAEGLERAADDAQLQAAPSLGDRPLVVLAAEQMMTAIPSWAEAQRRQAALSTNGRLIVPAGSVHYIHWEQPTLVIDAVRQVIEDVRSR